jgi:hypothetical protein
MDAEQILGNIRKRIIEVKGKVPTKVRLSPEIYDCIIHEDDPQDNIWGVSYRLDESLEQEWVVDTKRGDAA